MTNQPPGDYDVFHYLAGQSSARLANAAGIAAATVDRRVAALPPGARTVYDALARDFDEIYSRAMAPPDPQTIRSANLTAAAGEAAAINLARRAAAEQAVRRLARTVQRLEGELKLEREKSRVYEAALGRAVADVKLAVKVELALEAIAEAQQRTADRDKAT